MPHAPLAAAAPSAARKGSGRRGVDAGHARVAFRVRRLWTLWALLAMMVATAGPGLQAMASSHVKGLSKRPRMEVRAAVTTLRVLRRAPQPHRGLAQAPWRALLAQDGSVRTASALPSFRVRLPSAAASARAPSLYPPAAPTRAPPFPG